MLKEVYLLLKQQLSAISSLKNIDWFLDQYAQLGEDYVPASPEVFIEFTPITWSTLPGSIQRAELIFNVHLISDTAYGDERDMTDTSYIDHLNIEQNIFKALMNKRMLLSDLPGNAALLGTNNDRVMIESIIRMESIPHSGINNIISTIQTFKATIFDYTANPDTFQVIANINVDTSIQNPIQ